MDISFFNAAGALEELASYDDTQDIFPDISPWRGENPGKYHQWHDDNECWCADRIGKEWVTDSP